MASNKQKESEIAMASPHKKKIEKQKRALYVVTGGTLLGALLMFISVCTDYWVKLEIPNGRWRNGTQAFVVKHHSGLWRICRHEVDNVTHPVKHSKSKFLNCFN